MLAVLLLLAAPARAADWPLHLALGSYMALNGVDLAQTMHCLGAQQCREANRVMALFSDRPAVMGALKIGIDSAVVYAIIRIHKKHPRMAWLLTGLGIAVETYASVHNARLIPRRPE